MLDVYAALLGLVTGSYLNVVIHRLPRGESTVRPRSRCPYCLGGIRARDNLPVLSYLLLRGRCRRCGAPISWRYPAFEAATALLFVGVVERFGLTAEALASRPGASISSSSTTHSESASIDTTHTAP